MMAASWDCVADSQTILDLKEANAPFEYARDWFEIDETSIPARWSFQDLLEQGHTVASALRDVSVSEIECMRDDGDFASELEAADGLLAMARGGGACGAMADDACGKDRMEGDSKEDEDEDEYEVAAVEGDAKKIEE
jgi:hypothetical protein